MHVMVITPSFLSLVFYFSISQGSKETFDVRTRIIKMTGNSTVEY